MPSTVLVDQAVAAAARRARQAAPRRSSTPCCGASFASSGGRGRERLRRAGWRAGTIRRGGSIACAPTGRIAGRRSPRPTTRVPPMTLRVNARRATRGSLSSPSWLTHGMRRRAPSPARPCAWRGRLPVDAACPASAPATVSVQDGNAQRAAPSCCSRRPLAAGARVLDACAAPGGKTAQLLERADLELLAIDRDPARLARVDATLARLGLAARPSRRRRCAGPRPGGTAARSTAILLDAPCSASGIVRRHPDVRWLRRASDIAAAGGDPGPAARRPLAAARPGRPAPVLHLLAVPGRGPGPDRRFFATTRRRLPSLPSPPSPGHLLPLPDNDETPSRRLPAAAAGGRLFPDAASRNTETTPSS